VNHVRVDEEQSTTMLRGIHLGLLQPGVDAAKTIYLTNTGAAGDRVLDISIQSRCPSSETPVAAEPPEPESPVVALKDVSEALKTIIVPTVEAITSDFSVMYQYSSRATLGFSDLRTYDHDYWDDSVGGEALVTNKMGFKGPWGIKVESISLVKKVIARPSFF
jgi:trafficking protein particle complex subunit 11